MFIPSGLLYAIVPVLATGFVAFITWLVRAQGKNGELFAKAATQLASHDDRLKRLEGWQDGVQFGHAIARAEQKRD